MPQLLSLLRAARLVGVSRSALQRKIRNGELATFEGMVAADDLARAYPEAKLEDHSALERLEGIKDAAFARRLREHMLPSAEVLMTRLGEMGRERARFQAQTDYYRSLLEQLQLKLRELGGGPSTQTAMTRLLAWLTQRLEAVPQGNVSQPLLVQDSFLRIMTAHVRVLPGGREFLVDGNDSLLEAALRAGLSLDYGCSIGSCGKCKAKILSGEAQRTRHSDYALTAAEKNAGVVLMCCNTAATDLVIEAHEARGAADIPLQRIEARVKSVVPMGEAMRLLHLQTPRTSRLRFLAGQSVTLELPGGLTATCPVASCPCDDRNLQFHIQGRQGDRFAERVFNGLKSAETVRIEGPRGEFVLNEASQRPPIFIAAGTGFAPIKSVIEHAMALDATDVLHLYWVATGPEGHYLDNLCRAWSDALDNFAYTPLAASPGADIMEVVLQQVLRDHPLLADHDIYVAAPGPLAAAAEFGLLERGAPRAQLAVSKLDG